MPVCWYAMVSKVVKKTVSLTQANYRFLYGMWRKLQVQDPNETFSGALNSVLAMFRKEVS
jgi:hypothetical protein